MIAKSHRKGKRRSVAVAFVLSRDGEQNVLTEEELEKKRQEAKSQIEKDWEEAAELGGDAGDVFCFPLGLSQGDISAEIPLGLYAQTEHGQRPHPWKEGKSNCDFLLDELERLLKRAEEGEEIRIWYTPWNPNDLCALYWFLWYIFKRRKIATKLWLMELPILEPTTNGYVKHRGWGEIAPESLGSYLPLQRELPEGEALCCYCFEWALLRKENAPLRVWLNGKITSVDEDFYDGIIRRHIAKEEDEFSVPPLIGKMIANSCFHVVGDELIHRRITAMIEKGELAVVIPGEDGSYRGQVLRKIKK